MNKLIIALAVFSVGTMAEEGDKIQTVDHCVTVKEVAYLVMFERQMKNLDLAEAYVRTDNELARQITLGAYDISRYSSDEMRREVSRDYGNRWFKKCIDFISKEKKNG